MCFGTLNLNLWCTTLSGLPIGMMMTRLGIIWDLILQEKNTILFTARLNPRNTNENLIHIPSKAHRKSRIACIDGVAHYVDALDRW